MAKTEAPPAPRSAAKPVHPETDNPAKAQAAARASSGRPEQDSDIDDSVRIAPGPTIKVIATRVGYYDEKRRRVGDVFLLRPRYGTWTKKIMDKEYPTRQAFDKDTGERLVEEKYGILSAEDQFSPKWMERVDKNTRIKLTSPSEALKQEHDNIQGANQAAHMVSTEGATGPRPTGIDPTGDTKVLGDDD